MTCDGRSAQDANMKQVNVPISPPDKVTSLGLFEHSARDLLKDSTVFAEHAKSAAYNAGCRYLFELPGVLLKGNEAVIGDSCRAAAILCPQDDGCSVIFLLLNPAEQNIAVLEADEVPERVVEFAFSFAEVLSLLSPATSELVQ